MLEGMNTKKGAWVKPGDKGTSDKGKFPGSYGDYVYVRAPPAEYPKTAQQQKIGAAGAKCAVKGKSGKEIHHCLKKEFGVPVPEE